jgi:hypothetical protein
MKSWFPDLPNYANFNSRLNNLDSAVLSLLPLLLKYIDNEHIINRIDSQIALIDSFPIILCPGKRAGKIARELSDKSFCSTKNLFYYGVKVHMVAQRVRGSIPLMDFVSITPASENDLTAIRPILPKLASKAIFDDKTYIDARLNQQLINEQDTYTYTPVKLKKGQSKTEREFNKVGNDFFSTAVSRIRQPVESLFNWINDKTDLQNAAKVRSTNGLMIHIYGALVTVLLHYTF